MQKASLREHGGFSPERLRRLSRALQGYVERGEIGGAVVLIHRRGEEAYAEAIGWQEKETQIPLSRNTLFRIASMTKPITAVAALILVEEGKLRLYDPLDAWLPELANRMVMRDPQGSPDDVYPSPRAITLHDLLTYRLGIGSGKSSLQSQPSALNPAPLSRVELLDPDAWLARLGELPLLYEPGARWLYNVASDILGVLIARVSGQPLETFLRSNIFEPLAMADTGFAVPAEKRARLATLYLSSSEGGLTVRDHPQRTRWAEPPLFPSGAGGLVSTADDYQRFGRMLLNRGELDGVRILSRKTDAIEFSPVQQHAAKTLVIVGSGELDGVRILSRKTVEAMTTDYLT